MPTKEPKDAGLEDLPPREATPEKADEVKGGLEPPSGVKLNAIPLPNEPPNG